MSNNNDNDNPWDWDLQFWSNFHFLKGKTSFIPRQWAPCCVCVCVSLRACVCLCAIPQCRDHAESWYTHMIASNSFPVFKRLCIVHTYVQARNHCQGGESIGGVMWTSLYDENMFFSGREKLSWEIHICHMQMCGEGCVGFKKRVGKKKVHEDTDCVCGDVWFICASKINV